MASFSRFDMDDLTGLLWSHAIEMLRERGVSEPAVVDITPDRVPRTPTQEFAWGAARVVRAREVGGRVEVTISREMRRADEQPAEPQA